MNTCEITLPRGFASLLTRRFLMVKTADEIVQKSDELKGEDTAKTRVDKEADDMAKKASKTEQKFDRDNNIFTK